MDMDYETIRAEAKAAETRAIRTEKLKYLSISVAVVLLVLLLWQLAVQFQLVNTRFFDSPLGVVAVSYTHLDVYKRQVGPCPPSLSFNRISEYFGISLIGAYISTLIPLSRSPSATSCGKSLSVTIMSIEDREMV